VTRVAGIDGCRAGWVVITTGTRRNSPAAVAVVPDLAAVLSAPVDLVAVDMPIGLPASGSRACDVAARARLGPRRSSVFPTPVRAVLGSDSYPEALARSRAVDGRGLSKQAWFLLPKIAELDLLVSAASASRVCECHPESVFVTLAGRPLQTTKHTAGGLAERAALLRPHFPDLDRHLEARIPGARADDVLDAFAAAEAARRHARGRAVVLGDGARDERGLLMQIIA
jgi:predicted RNase H-like nuclease